MRNSRSSLVAAMALAMIAGGNFAVASPARSNAAPSRPRRRPDGYPEGSLQREIAEWNERVQRERDEKNLAKLQRQVKGRR